jgi:GDP-L-fucose synthase
MNLTLDSRIFVAGHQGMVGSALVRQLRATGHRHVLTRDRADLDLRDARQVQAYFEAVKPDAVYLAAARVGGIAANQRLPVEFIQDNLQIQCHVMQSAFAVGCRRLLFLGSSCIYPRDAAQPMPEEALLSGPLEPTNAPYAIAKIAGIQMCQSYNREYGASHGMDYRCVMPTNLYGPGDRYHPEHSHVIAALMHRMQMAREQQAPHVEVWGSGEAMREFLHVDDLARACLTVMQLSKTAHGRLTTPERLHLNVGSGEEVSIRSLAQEIARLAGYGGELRFDARRPDGPARKALDSTRLLSLGWRPRFHLASGLAHTWADFVARAQPWSQEVNA